MLIIIFSLISVAFYTLIERRVLGNFHIRIGPYIVGFIGYFQPFRDAIKLFVKSNLNLRFNLSFIWSFWAAYSLVLYVFLLLVYPLSGGYFFINTIFLLFICLVRTRVYFVLIGGYISGRKYRILGSYRAIVQIISYEIIIIILFVIFFYFFNSWNFTERYFLFENFNMLFCLPFIFIWLITILSESNRLPYDFLEGESELVSGFNTEYWGGYFSFLFIYEYGCIVLFRLLSSYILFRGFFRILFFFFMLFIFLWVRATYPRFRFDFLMQLIWKKMLPLIISILIFVVCL